MIDKELAAFLQEGIAIQIGTRNDNLQPNATRVVAVRVDDAGTHVVAYVPERAVTYVESDLRGNGQAAIVFARPPDERSCQLKGTLEGMGPAAPSDEPFVRDQWSRWLERLTMIGLPISTFEGWDVWPCVAIRIRITARFN